MAAYVEDKSDTLPPPRELELAWQFRAAGQLPEAGALFDQPAGLLRRMLHAEHVYTTLVGYNRAEKLSVWTRQNPDGWKLIQRIESMQKANA